VLVAGIRDARAQAAALRAEHQHDPPRVVGSVIGHAGVGGGPFFEFPYDPPGWTPERRDFLLAEPLRPGPDGMLAVPDAPGLGAVLA